MKYILKRLNKNMWIINFMMKHNVRIINLLWYNLIAKIIWKFKISWFSINGYHDEFDSGCLHSNIITWPYQLIKKSSCVNFSNKTKTALSSSHPSCFCNALEVNLPVSDYWLNKWNHASSFSIVRLVSSSNDHPVISADVL